MGSHFATGSSATNPVNAEVDGAAQAAHETTRKIADRAVARVDRVSATMRRAGDGTADAAGSGRWASSIPGQAKQAQTRLTEAASASLRARPIATVADALIVGYLLGRLARR